VARRSASGRRLHLVLVPGFAGFDALGQLEYYAGVTPQFRKWQSSAKYRSRAVLHYFDNFPTASVASRAARLQNYLAKRIARGEFQPGDDLALIGHSTGGLDIRRLIADLAQAPPEELITVDGLEGDPLQLNSILPMIRRIVFLSVPQWGTNIADWVRQYAVLWEVFISQLRAAVEASQVPVIGSFETLFSRFAAGWTDLDIVLAVQDALEEAQAGAAEDGMRTAQAHEAAADLALWLRHIFWDFSGIDDLSAAAPDGEPVSPAHFTMKRRRQEIETWAKFGIETRSYATIAPRAFRFDEGQRAPVWDLMKPWTYPEWTPPGNLAGDSDIAYCTCYRACAGGPFSMVAAANKRTIESWDNDGIVNTASMMWPDGRLTILVDADHGDIIGHYARKPSPGGEGRAWRAYDLLKSGAGFDDAAFERVWNSVFEFCAQGAQD
jgi:triacylglycerol lipase